MDKHMIEIEILPDGKFTAEVKGVTGPACSDITKFLDNLGVVELDEKTSDYYKKPGQGLTVKA